jgi:hypothetical protein
MDRVSSMRFWRVRFAVFPTGADSKVASVMDNFRRFLEDLHRILAAFKVAQAARACVCGPRSGPRAS